MLFDLKDPETKKTIIAMIEEYRENIQPVITTELQKKYSPSKGREVVEQTKFAWFSKVEILQFLAANEQANGVRIYFAAHKESTVVKNESDCEYQGQLTVVLVPTKADGDKESTKHSPDILDGVALDRGSICKPDCPDEDDDASNLLFA